MKKIVLGILSHSQNAYSETFIKAHKDLLPFNSRYYFGSSLPNRLETGASFSSLTSGIAVKILFIIQKIFFRKFSFPEFALYRSLKKNKISVVLAEYGNTGAAVVEICRKLKLPLLVHFHGYDASVESVLKDCGYYKDLFQYAKYIFIVSAPMKERLLSLGCPPEKLVYNPYGPHESFFDVHLNAPGKKFISLGRFVNKKAPYYSILAFKKVMEKHPDAELIMGGNGVLWEMCYNLVKYYNLQENIKLPGVVSPEEFKNHLADSLAFVQHSVIAMDGDMEGMPVAILEANAAGVPVIATKHAGIPEVIIHRENGFLIDEHDVASMANYITELIEKPWLAKEMGLKGKEIIQKDFTMSMHINRISHYINLSVNNELRD